MSLWVMLDDSVATDELLAGAGASALAAFVAELAFYQGRVRGSRLRARWLVPALSLPWPASARHGHRLRGAVAAAGPRAPSRPAGSARCPSGSARHRRGQDPPGAAGRRAVRRPEHVRARPRSRARRDGRPPAGGRARERRPVNAFVIAAIAMLVAVDPVRDCDMAGRRHGGRGGLRGHQRHRRDGASCCSPRVSAGRASSSCPSCSRCSLLGSGLVFVRFLERWL